MKTSALSISGSLVRIFAAFRASAVPSTNRKDSNRWLRVTLGMPLCFNMLAVRSNFRPSQSGQLSDSFPCQTTQPRSLQVRQIVSTHFSPSHRGTSNFSMASRFRCTASVRVFIFVSRSPWSRTCPSLCTFCLPIFIFPTLPP